MINFYVDDKVKGRRFWKWFVRYQNVELHVHYVRRDSVCIYLKYFDVLVRLSAVGPGARLGLFGCWPNIFAGKPVGIWLDAKIVNFL